MRCTRPIHSIGLPLALRLHGEMRMLLAIAWVVLTAWGEPYRVTGRVVNETSAPVEGARILLKCSTVTTQALSDPTGAFRLDLPDGSACRLRVERDGFFPLVDRALEPSQDGTDLRLVLTPAARIGPGDRSQRRPRRS